jgi:hypothetical protein
MSGEVQAGYLHITEVVTSDGTDTAINFGGHGTLLDVRPFLFLTVEVRPGASNCDFTINAYETSDKSGVATELYAKSASTTDELIATKLDIGGHAFVEILEDGTAAESQTVIVLAK